MKIGKVFFAFTLVMILLFGLPTASRARVMLTADTNGLMFSVMPTAIFTVDDWMSTPNLWTLTISNTSDKAIRFARLEVTIKQSTYGMVANTFIYVIGTQESARYIPEYRHSLPFFQETLAGGASYFIINTMINESTEQVALGKWSPDFKDEVLRIGYLPEGRYSMAFTLVYYYEGDDNVYNEILEEDILEIKNPQPAELITPEDNDETVIEIPRFTWQKPETSSILVAGNPEIMVNYTLKLWKMFDESGTQLSEEDAISRIPIWEKTGLITPSVDFNPSESREELMSGRSYCWQVQAFDGTGRYISTINEGKSDIWQFTIKYTSLAINEPLMFFPLRFSWTPARTGGGVVLYNIGIADNPDFAGAYRKQNQVSTSFAYPGNAPALNYGVTYYLQVQATDEGGIPIGEPARLAFTLPSTEVILSSPEDGSKSPTLTPAFQWQGETDYYTLTINAEEGEWTYHSTAIEGKSWTYSGEELARGATYTWYVTPSNELGDPVGENSIARSFSIPPEDQITLISPVNTRIETVFPELSWNRFAPATGDNVVYRLVIQDDGGNVVHTEDVPGTSFTYPSSAEGLTYAKRYTWSVGAVIGGDEVGTRSMDAWFVTPFIEGGGGELTITQVDEAIRLVLSDYPQFTEFSEMILTGIQGESGPITPGQLMEIIEKFKIVNVTVK
ncbi:MAG: hypothetical protein JXB48_19230 [Candidatus Latescibacteria bacterium]|nr:hypothetical protein [Candidatus Latescibacterota bacterium]